MKLFKNLFSAFALLVALSGLAHAARVVYSRSLVNESALAYNNTYTLDMGASLLPWSNIDTLSMQAVYSSATVAAVNFIDGTKSTGTITINIFQGVIGAQATNTLTVANTTYINANPVYFTLNGYQLVKGDLWSATSSSATTAANICSAINNYGATNTTFSASTTSAGVCTITTISSGTFSNTYTLTSSSQAALSAGGATFSGGQNHGFLVINGTTLVEGTDFTAVTSSHVTAGNIKNAINANATLSAIVVAATSTTLGVVSATSTNVGSSTNYGWFSNNNSTITMSNHGLYGGTDSDVASNVFTKASHGLTTALPVLFTTTSGTPPQNLVAGTTYYAIKVTANTFKLATSAANAIAGTAITISTVTGSGTFALTPLGITGTPSFKWQGSNDNTNWNDVSVSSVTMSSLAAASTTWDFGSINYRYIRLNVLAPTTGGISLVVTGIGKSSQ